MVGAAKESEYMASLDVLAEQAFDDQCTGANPRYPLISDLKQIYAEAWTHPITDLLKKPF
jgi:acetaldehyde dehydrogenase/alcohol dehydrogenase